MEAKIRALNITLMIPNQRKTIYKKAYLNLHHKATSFWKALKTAEKQIPHKQNKHLLK